MQPKQITVRKGIGREVNQFPWFIEFRIAQDIEYYKNPKWEEFERSAQHYPCPELDHTKEGETVLAELVDAVEKGNGKIEIYKFKPLYGIDELGWKEIKVWKLIPEQKQPEKEAEMISVHKVDELLELQKQDIKAWLHRRARDFGGISYSQIDEFMDDYEILQYHKR